MEYLGQITFGFLRNYGYFAMFPLMIVQGSVVTVVAATLASLGIFWWPAVFFLSVLGDLIGNLVLYFLGYRWGMKFVHNFGKYLGINEKRVLRMEKYFQKHGGKTILLMKPITGLYSVAFVAAGVVKMDFKKFFNYSLLSGILWSGFLMTIGYFYGYLWKSASRYLSWVAMAIAFVAIVSYILVSKYEKKHSDELLK